MSDGLDQPGLSLDENLARIAQAPLLFEPGTAWSYSLATDVLGGVVAKAGGAPLPDVVRRLVTGPLGLDASFTVGDPDRLAVPYGDASPQWMGAYGHHFWVDPSAKLTVVVLTNTAFAGMVGEFPDTVRRAVYGPAQP